MSKLLRALVTQRLSAAAEDICALFEQEVLLLSHSNSSQQERPDSQQQRPDSQQQSPTTGVQIVSMKKEEQLQEPEEQLQEPLFAIVHVKTEEDEDKSSELHQRVTVENREDSDVWECGAGAGCSSDPLTQLHSDSEDHTDSSDHTDHSEDYSQEQALAKRSYAMVPPDHTPFSRSDHTPFSCSDQRPFICPDCGGSFIRNRDLKRHMVVHVGEKPFVCSVCEKAFSKKSDLARHQAFVHHFCSGCSRCFTDRISLNEHLRTHVEEGTLDQSSALFTEIGKPFSCSECGKKFRAKSYLQRHMLVHTEERPHKCPVCQKCFKDKADLKKHLVRCRKRFTSNGETKRPFRCSVCGKSFISEAYLTNHTKRAHPYCGVCQSHFTDDTELKAHLRTHVDDGTL